MDLLGGTDERPAIRLERWIGHGIDIGIKIDRGQVSFIARDVLEALKLDLDWTKEQPDRTANSRERALHCTAWALDQLASVCHAYGSDFALALLRWAEGKVDEFTQAGTDSIERASVPAPAPITTLGAAQHERTAGAGQLPESYSVADAAALLSRDPSIAIGQTRLFDFMRTRGWVTRPGSSWQPAKDLTALGWLRIEHRKVRNTGQVYPQVFITPLGLQQLHAALGGTAAIQLDLTAPALTEESK